MRPSTCNACSSQNSKELCWHHLFEFETLLHGWLHPPRVLFRDCVLDRIVHHVKGRILAVFSVLLPKHDETVVVPLATTAPSIGHVLTATVSRRSRQVILLLLRFLDWHGTRHDENSRLWLVDTDRKLTDWQTDYFFYFILFQRIARVIHSFIKSMFLH